MRQVDGQNQGEPAVRLLEALETKSTESREIEFWLALLTTCICSYK
jgi:hypothetical protein